MYLMIVEEGEALDVALVKLHQLILNHVVNVQALIHIRLHPNITS